MLHEYIILNITYLILDFALRECKPLQWLTMHYMARACQMEQWQVWIISTVTTIWFDRWQ